MKKKLITTLGITFITSLALFIPSVQTFAVSALSVFRVNDLKTIKITVADIQEAVDYFENNKSNYEDLHSEQIVNNYFSYQPSNVKNVVPKELNSVNEFTDFSFKLPRELKDETPSIEAVDSNSIKFSLNTEGINKTLSKLDNSLLLDDNLNGTEISITTPAMVVAKYNNSEILLFATQNIVFDTKADAKQEIFNTLINLPIVPTNIRSQLANINIESQDIYLPVLVGVGRETNINGSTGYIYAMSDLKLFVQTLPFNMNISDAENISALVWTKDGVLYCLTGNKTDGELLNIARSIN